MKIAFTCIHHVRTAAPKLCALGMTFGGEALLRQTVAELIQTHATDI